MKCQLSLNSTNHLLFSPFRPIWPVLAWAYRLVCTSLSGLREERKKYSIGKLGYTSVCAESGTQRQLKWHGAGEKSHKHLLLRYLKMHTRKSICMRDDDDDGNQRKKSSSWKPEAIFGDLLFFPPCANGDTNYWANLSRKTSRQVRFCLGPISSRWQSRSKSG